MGIIQHIEAADIAIAEATAPAEETMLGRTVGKLGKLGDQPPLLALASLTTLAGVLRKDRRLASAGARMVATHLLATGMKALLKRGIDRSRPSILLEQGHYEAHAGDSRDHDMTSFPSGHTAGLTAVARALGRDYPEYAAAGGSAALTLSLIQIPRRAHYTSDVAAGAVLGLIADVIVSRAWPSARRRQGATDVLDAVLFDVDGTLIDSNHQHAKAWQDAFGEFGHDVAIEAIQRQIGKGGDQLMPEFLLPKELDSSGKQIEKRYGEIFKQRYLGEVSPFADVPALLKRVRASGLRVALASSAKKDLLKQFKTIAGIQRLTDAETTSDDAEASKPHPDIFAAALKQLGDLEPTKAIVVGDTPYDAQAARRAGLPAIGLTCGGWSEDDLRMAGCIAVYADPADLLEHFATSPLAAGYSR